MAFMKTLDLEGSILSERRYYRVYGGIIPKHHHPWHVEGILDDERITSTKFSGQSFDTWHEFEEAMGKKFDFIALEIVQEVNTIKVDEVILDKTKTHG